MRGPFTWKSGRCFSVLRASAQMSAIVARLWCMRHLVFLSTSVKSAGTSYLHHISEEWGERDNDKLRQLISLDSRIAVGRRCFFENVLGISRL